MRYILLVLVLGLGACGKEKVPLTAGQQFKQSLQGTCAEGEIARYLGSQCLCFSPVVGAYECPKPY